MFNISTTFPRQSPPNMKKNVQMSNISRKCSPSITTLMGTGREDINSAVFSFGNALSSTTREHDKHDNFIFFLLSIDSDKTSVESPLFRFLFFLAPE